MSEGRGRHQWAHTAALMSLIANANRDPEKRPTPFLPSDFDPYESHAKKQPVEEKVDISVLKNFL